MPLDLEAIRTFVKVAELGSFTRAGEHLASSKSRASLHVQALERELGSQLLTRSTRAVKLTADGELFLTHARRLLADADALSALFQAPRTLRGPVRLDLPIALARDVIIPRLPELLAAHPQLELLVSTTDRRVDVVRDGFDCVLRIGTLRDSDLLAKKLGALHVVNCASPSYLRKHGLPRSLADLSAHVLVHYSLRFGADRASFEYRDGERYRELPMRSALTVNNTDAYRAACVAGLGIIQAPRYGLQALLASGALVELLPELTSEPLQVSLVHPRGVPMRVRAVMSWLESSLAPHLTQTRK
jgi:DNA-binding transcriptional LysR family regulator